MKKRRYITPIRSKTLRNETREAFEFAASADIGMTGTALTDGLDGDGPMLQIASMACLKALLELAVTMNSKALTPLQHDSATRFLNICKWTIQRWGITGCEIITHICLLGSLLEEIESGAKFYAQMSTGDKVIIDVTQSFTYAIKNARAIKAGTFTTTH